MASLTKVFSSLPFASTIRQLEQEMETVIKVIKPGPLGVIEHKFSATEINKAKATIDKALQNWRKNASVEKNSPIMKDFIDI